MKNRLWKWLIAAMLFCAIPAYAGAASLGDIDYIYAETAYTLLPVNEEITWTLAFDGAADMGEYTIAAEFHHRGFGDHDRSYTYHTSGTVEDGRITATLTKEGRYVLYLTVTDEQGNSGSVLAGYYVTTGDGSAALKKALAGVKAECLASGADNDYDKARFVHDYIINRADYDTDAARKDDPEGVLIDGAGVCQSYSYAFQLLMKELGIECLLVEDITGKEHVWNLIRVEGKWYHVDCTFDESTYYGIQNNYSDEHFMIPDEVCEKNHVWSRHFYPSCDTYLDGRYLRSDVYFTDQKSFDEQLNACLDSGKMKNVIIHYAGTDTDFSYNKLSIFFDRWNSSYGRQYGIDGWMVRTLSENRYYRYSVSFHVASGDVPDEYDGIIDDFAYTIGEDGITIARYLGAAENVVVPAYIGGYPVTHIGSTAFCEHQTLRAVQLPETLKAIDDGYYDNIWASGEGGAFAKCGALTSICIPGSVEKIGQYAFKGCVSLRSITLEEGVKELGKYALGECSSLTELTFPSTMEIVGQGALTNTALTRLHFPASLVAYHSINSIKTLECFTVDSANPAYTAHEGVLFDKAVTELIAYPIGKKDTSFSYPEGIQRVGIVWDLSEADALQEITFPASVTDIFEAFQKPTNIRAYHVAENNPKYIAVDGILYSRDMTKLVAFPSKKNIPEYVMPDTVTDTDIFALCGMTYVKKLTVSKNLKTFYYAWNCAALEEVVFQEGGALERIEGGFKGCTSLRSVSIPEGITTLKETFQNCTALKNVRLPSTLKEIEGVFWGCTALSEIELPDGLEAIHANAFLYCESLRKIRIPSSVNTIGVQAFYGCSRLRFVYMDAVPAYYPYKIFLSGVVLVSKNPAIEAFAEEIGCMYQYPPDVCDHSGRNVEIRPATTTEDGYLGEFICVLCGQFSMSKHIISWCILDLPSGLKTIGEEAFVGTVMEQVEIHDQTTTIGARAFADCRFLYLVIVPDSVTEIAEDAFEGCEEIAILCSEGSYAQAYAAENDIVYFVH